MTHRVLTASFARQESASFFRSRQRIYPFETQGVWGRATLNASFRALRRTKLQLRPKTPLGERLISPVFCFGSVVARSGEEASPRSSKVIPLGPEVFLVSFLGPFGLILRVPLPHFAHCRPRETATTVSPKAPLPVALAPNASVRASRRSGLGFRANLRRRQESHLRSAVWTTSLSPNRSPVVHSTRGARGPFRLPRAPFFLLRKHRNPTASAKTTLPVRLPPLRKIVLVPREVGVRAAPTFPGSAASPGC
jgi:hypothetical protein